MGECAVFNPVIVDRRNTALLNLCRDHRWCKADKLISPQGLRDDPVQRPEKQMPLRNIQQHAQCFSKSESLWEKYKKLSSKNGNRDKTDAAQGNLEVEAMATDKCAPRGRNEHEYLRSSAVDLPTHIRECDRQLHSPVAQGGVLAPLDNLVAGR